MKPTAALHQLHLRPLPQWIETLFEQQHASPRLVAHAHLVADVAAQLVSDVYRIAPAIALDAALVIAGGALHDIGKVVHPEELSQPGHAHEAAGYTLLIGLGVPAAVARFTQTHGRWKERASLPLEDALVALADTCWKGKRDQLLEQQIAVRLAEEGDYWQVWLAFDECIEQITADAPKRLAWQQQFATF